MRGCWAGKSPRVSAPGEGVRVCIANGIESGAAFDAMCVFPSLFGVFCFVLCCFVCLFKLTVLVSLTACLPGLFFCMSSKFEGVTLPTMGPYFRKLIVFIWANKPN